MRQVLSSINPSPRIKRVASVVAYYARGIVRLFMETEIFLMAQAIAFKVLVTIVPVLILLTGILAWILARDAPFARIAQLIHEFLPPYQSEQLIAFLYQLQLSWGTLTLVGSVFLFLTAVTLFSTLRRTITLVFNRSWRQGRTFLGQYLLDARMVLQVGVFFLLTIAVTVGAQIVDALGSDYIEEAGLDYFWVVEGWNTAFQLISFALPLAITMAMFFQLYYFIPKPKPPLRSALLGSFVAGVLWEVIKYAFTWYARSFGRFDRYAETEGSLAPIGEAFGLIIFFVFWVYYSGLVFLMGAFFTLLSEERLIGTERQTEKDEEAPSAEAQDARDGHDGAGEPSEARRTAQESAR